MQEQRVSQKTENLRTGFRKDPSSEQLLAKVELHGDAVQLQHIQTQS